MLRERLGELLPEGVALGPGGELTRDPTMARRGALLPFGGYKGFGLALREGLEIDRVVFDALVAPRTR